jgi:hypothetical protein
MYIPDKLVTQLKTKYAVSTTYQSLHLTNLFFFFLTSSKNESVVAGMRCDAMRCGKVLLVLECSSGCEWHLSMSCHAFFALSLSTAGLFVCLFVCLFECNYVIWFFYFPMVHKHTPQT